MGGLGRNYDTLPSAPPRLNPFQCPLLRFAKSSRGESKLAERKYVHATRLDPLEQRFMPGQREAL